MIDSLSSCTATTDKASIQKFVKVITSSRDDIAEKFKAELSPYSIDKEIASHISNNFSKQSLIFSEIGGPMMAGTCSKLQEKIESILNTMETVHKN